MKLRTRLAITVGAATVAVLAVLGWAQSRLHSRLSLEAMANAVVHRMESGGRTRCEANPAEWPRLGGRRRGLPPGAGPGGRGLRLWAYDSTLTSRDPKAPPFPTELAEQLKSGEDIALSGTFGRRRGQVAIRMPWSEGPCAVVLLRGKGPPSWRSPPVLVPVLVVSVVVVIVALIAAGPIVQRVRRLTEAVERGDPISIGGDDEIGELGRAFEKSRKTIQGQLRSLETREAALRNYIANTTHDVMLPLSVLQGHLVALQQRVEAGEALEPKSLTPTIEEAQYLGSLLHNLNAAARLESVPGLPHRDKIELGRLVDRIVERHQPIAKRKRIQLEVGLPERDVEFMGDLTLLEQAFGNVVQNAVRYNRAEGHVAVVLDGTTDRWTLRVVDDGPGIPAEERAKAVRPSFRGSEARTRHPHGMGLGLHIASDVAERHDLTMTLSETDGGGLTVSFVYPATADT